MLTFAHSWRKIPAALWVPNIPLIRYEIICEKLNNKWCYVSSLITLLINNEEKTIITFMKHTKKIITFRYI